MAGLRVGNLYWEIGTGDFLHAFFSTISYHLEPDGFGTRLPTLMGRLYAGEMSPKLAAEAKRELLTARQELRTLGPEEVIWDLENLSAKPPWGSNISPEITNLSEYFVTSDGRDVFGVFETALTELEQSSEPLRVE